MMNTYSALALLGLVIAAFVLVYMFKIHGDKERRIVDLSGEQQKNESPERFGNIFEMLELVRDDLEASKISLQNITPRSEILLKKKSVLLPRVENSGDKNGLLKTSHFFMEGDKAEDAVVEKIGAVNETTDSSSLELKIAKTTENIHGLNDALKRLLAAKMSVRAEARSSAMDDVSGLSSFRPYLPVFLGEELYAVCISTVQEVLQANRLFVDSGIPKKNRSAINLDGAVVPVIDLGNHFGGEITKVSRNTFIVILLLDVDGGLQRFGFKVDGVGEIMMVDQSSVLPSRVKADKAQNDFLQGEYKTEHYSITLLDFNKGFTSKNILALSKFSLPSSA